MKFVRIFPLAMAVSILVAVFRPAKAGGFLIYEHGAVSTGMANARTALAGDPSSLYFNPAAITELEGIQIEAGVTLIAPSIEYDPVGPSGQGRSYTGYRDGAYVQVPVNDGLNPSSAEFKLFTPIHLYLSWKLPWAGLSVGYGLNNPFGLGTHWPDGWDGRFIATDTEVQTFMNQPVVAADLAQWIGLDGVKFSLAAGYDFVWGKATLGRHIDLRAAEALSLGELQAPEAALELTGTGIGHGWNVAAYFEIPGWFSAGLSFRSGISLPLAGSAKFVMDAQAREAASYLGLEVPDETTGRVTLDLPATLNAGVALLAIEDLRIAADLYLAFFESYDELAITFDCVDDGSCSDSLAPDPIEKNWHASVQFSLGAEWKAWRELRLRAGWGLVTSPVPPETYDPSLPDGMRNLFSVGLGWQGAFWAADLGYLLAFWSGSKENRVGAGDDFAPEGMANGDYETVSHQLAVSLRFWWGGRS